jgi:sortase A
VTAQPDRYDDDYDDHDSEERRRNPWLDPQVDDTEPEGTGSFADTWEAFVARERAQAREAVEARRRGRRGRGWQEVGSVEETANRLEFERNPYDGRDSERAGAGRVGAHRSEDSSFRIDFRTIVRGFGQTLVTLGLITLLFTVYEVWGTGQYEKHAQHQLQRQLDQQWNQPPGHDAGQAQTNPFDVPLGSGYAVLYIPKLGQNWHKVVVQGVTVGDLKKGPGHYPDSAAPGEVGNFAIAGHRTTYGNGFWDLDKVKPGDPIVIRTRDTWFVYKMGSSTNVLPSAVDVVAPVPQHPGKKATKKMITLTTCEKWGNAKRYVVFGELSSTMPYTTPDNVPPELKG